MSGRSFRPVVLAALIALASLGCDEPPVSPTPRRWTCPTRWVPYALGGCGPAALLCAPDGGAAQGVCAGADGTRAERVEDPDHGWGIALHRRVDGTFGGAWLELASAHGPPAVQWTPDSVPDADWDPGADLMICPPTWAGYGDGTCDPRLPSDCPEGSFALPGGRCTPTAERDCPESEWADVSSEAAGAPVLRVRAGADAAGADGSAERPFPTLSAAIEQAPIGAWVLVARGTWREPVSVGWSLHLVGVCAARVSLVGVESSSEPEAPTVRATGAGTSLDLRGVTVSAGVVGVLARAGARVTLRASRVDRAVRVGVLATGAGSEAIVTDAAVTNGRALPDGSRGHGVVALMGAAVRIERAHIADNRGFGLEVSGAGSSLVASVVVVRATREGVYDAAPYGAGVTAQDRGFAMLDRAVLSGNALMGGLAARGGVLSLTMVTVADTQPHVVGRTSSLGQGLVAFNGGRIETRWVGLRGNSSAGVAAFEASYVSLLESTVRDVRSVFDGVTHRGGGVVAGARGHVRLAAVRVESCDGIGVSAEGADSFAEGERVVIAGTRPTPEVTLGLGVAAVRGGRVALRNALVVDNRFVGVSAIDEGSTVEFERGVIRGTEPLPDEVLGAVGLLARDGGRVTAAMVRVTDNFGTGALADRGGEVSLTASLIARTTQRTEVDGRPNEFAGLGLLAGAGGRLVASRVALVDNARFGAFSSGSGSELTFTDGVIRGTGASADADDRAVTFALGASLAGRVVAERVTVADNRVSAAVIADGAGTSLSFVDGAVTGTRPTNLDASGQGVQATRGASLGLARTLLDDNRTVAVAVYGAGTSARISDVAVTRTGFGPFQGLQGGGVGLVVGVGATASARRILVTEASQVGVWAIERGTSLDVEDALVLGVSPVVNSAQSAFGGGVIAQAGARIEARRVAVVGTHGLAFGAVLTGEPMGPRTPDARLTLSDVFARSVTAEAIQYGVTQGRRVAYGVHVASGCAADVTRAVFDDGEWGFFRSSGAMALRDGVVARQRRGAGASNGATSEGQLVLDRVTFIEVASGVTRDIELPEALLPPPPLP